MTDSAVSAKPVLMRTPPPFSAADTFPSRDLERIFTIRQPLEQTIPLVIASPHSGRQYDAAFLAASPLDPRTLRSSEDCFVDEIFAGAVALGAPLLSAQFPRVFVDANREAFELDPLMFNEKLPTYVNTQSPRVVAGLGTIARIVATGDHIYRNKLSFAEALERVSHYYHPYHTALRQLIDHTLRQFNACLLIDGHSMPSTGGPMEQDRGRPRPDIVLGDCYGNACNSMITDAAEQAFHNFGYSVTRNKPYAGGYTTRHYGKPHKRVHALQIEINRALYMDEATLTRKPAIAGLSRHMELMIEALVRVNIIDQALS